MKKIALITLLTSLLFSSCTMEKRLYNRGFHIEWIGMGKAKNKASKTPVPRSAKTQSKTMEPEAAELLTEDPFDFPFFLTELQYEQWVEKGVSEHTISQIRASDIVSISKEPRHTAEYYLQMDVQASDLREVETQSETSESGKRKMSDWLLYLGAGLIGLLAFGTVQSQRKRARKLTRWAKNNPKKTIGLLALIQIKLAVLAVLTGYSLRKLGFEFSDMTAYASYGMMLLSAFFVPFKARNLSIALPKTLRTVRLGYLGIAMSALMMFSNFGNQLAERYQGSTFHQVVESADSYIYDQQPDPGSSADADQKIEKRRKMIAAGSCALAVFLIVLLILTTCGGVCLIIFAVGGAWPTALGTVAAIVGGALVAGFSIFGIVKAVQMC